MMQPARTIDEVVNNLTLIINESKSNQSALGYFAALYRKVTIRVRQGIENNEFDDGKRMEQLDVIFANRYIQAYINYQNQQSVTKSWLVAFQYAVLSQPIVLQHLLIGMNAHINLDLGIAAAEVSAGKDIADLKADFGRINDVLSSLVEGVENDLTEIWPTLKKLLRLAGNLDNWMADFSMKLARNGAWKFACSLADSSPDQWSEQIKSRDRKVSSIARLITNPGLLTRLVFYFVRSGEKGSILDKIDDLMH